MKKSKILIVDDEPMMLDLMVELLQSTYELLLANNGNEALEVLKSNTPDLILMDWNMPGLSGLETVEIIKSQHETKDILIIMVTGQMTKTENLDEAYRKGVVDFIRKPFDPVELQARIKAMVTLAHFYQEQINQKNKELMALALKLTENIEFVKEVLINLKQYQRDEEKDGQLIEISAQINQKVCDQSFIQFENKFVNVYPEFYNNLSRQHQNLTATELKLCALLKLNLSSKEIAVITHNSIDSIKVSRTRLRKKLQLANDDNLVGYLARF